MIGVLLLAALQDFQVGARAKAMGGSYTAFGDDPVAIWTNPAGTAQQNSMFALTYQSFTQYEFDDFSDEVPATAEGDAEQGLLDPPISPSFAGLVAKLDSEPVETALSLAYIRPFQIKYVYAYDDPDPLQDDLLTQTDQQFSRLRAGGSMSFRLSERSPWFRSVSVGLGVDYVYTKYKEIDQNTNPDRDTQVYEDSESALGYGAGLLVTVYDGDALRLDGGAAYNSPVDFNFDLDRNAYPVWDWPSLVSAGFALYAFEGYPLRLTFDVQRIGWERAVGRPSPGNAGFEDATCWSAGLEYRLNVFTKYRLFLRAGWKHYDTPWGDGSDLPWLGDSQLRIDTKGDVIEILTLGLGLYWTRENPQGVVRLAGLDLAVELFGETETLIGIGYTYQLD
jgi:long-subunit fatty acid transport protein